jgi:hypothetical protein
MTVVGVYEGNYMLRAVKTVIAGTMVLGAGVLVVGDAGASVPKPTPTFCAAVKTLSNLHSLSGVKAVIGTSASSHALYAADIAALVRAGHAAPSSPAAEVARGLAGSLESAHSYEVKFSTASIFSKAVDGAKVAYYDTKAAAYGVDLYVYYRACS